MANSGTAPIDPEDAGTNMSDIAEGDLLPIDERLKQALSGGPKRRYTQVPFPTFAPDMEELFDQLWVKVQRSLATANGDDAVLDEPAEIRNQSIQSLVVTSWGPDEGSSTTALGLATRAAAACRGNVLLVDADGDHSKLTKMAGLEIRPGLRQLVQQEIELDGAVVRMGDSNLYLMPVGSGSETEALSENRLQAVLTELEERFRFVIFDVPCLKHGVEGYQWGRFAVNAVLVVRAGSARRQTVAHAVSTMRSHGLRVVGTILNRRVDLIPAWLYPYL